MQTLNSTPHQTIQANAKKLHDLATWYAETSAAHALEAGRTTQAASDAHKTTHNLMSSRAIQLEQMAGSLDSYLAERSNKEKSPAIDKKTLFTVSMSNIGSVIR